MIDRTNRFLPNSREPIPMENFNHKMISRSLKSCHIKLVFPILFVCLFTFFTLEYKTIMFMASKLPVSFLPKSCLLKHWTFFHRSGRTDKMENMSKQGNLNIIFSLKENRKHSVGNLGPNWKLFRFKWCKNVFRFF